MLGNGIVMGQFQGVVYAAVAMTGFTSWFEARDLAQKFGAGSTGWGLVSISSPSENAFVTSLFADDPRFTDCWIGLYQPPGAAEPADFEWESGEAFVYQNWSPAQPDDHLGIEDYVEIGPDGKWNDLPVSYHAAIGAIYELRIDRALTVSGTVGQDVLVGSAFGDRLYGDEGRDSLSGGAGSDTLLGASGEDVLDGGGGRDRLFGGRGSDTFVFASTFDSRIGFHDTVRDFDAGRDFVDLTAVDAIAGTVVDDAFVFIGYTVFSGVAGELRLKNHGGLLFLRGDTDGDGLADLSIQLGGSPAVTAGDILL